MEEWADSDKRWDDNIHENRILILWIGSKSVIILSLNPEKVPQARLKSEWWVSLIEATDKTKRMVPDRSYIYVL